MLNFLFLNFKNWYSFIVIGIEYIGFRNKNFLKLAKNGILHVNSIEKKFTIENQGKFFSKLALCSRSQRFLTKS